MSLKYKKIIFLTVGLALMSLPVLASAQSGSNLIPGMSVFAPTFGTGSLTQIIRTAINIFLSLLGIIAVLLIIYSGWLWMMSQGDPAKIDKAKKVIYGAVIGLLIIFASYTIVVFIWNFFGFDSSPDIPTPGSECLESEEGKSYRCGCNGTITCTDGQWSECIGDNPLACINQPLHCSNKVQDEDETGVDCGGSCRRCHGAVCVDNDDCAFGACVDGFCVSKPEITYIDPAMDVNGDTDRDKITTATVADDISNGAPGNYITIYGRNFGSKTGSVYFRKQGVNSPAEIPCLKSWTNNQIVAVVPAGLSQVEATENSEVAGLGKNYEVIIEVAGGGLFSDPWGFQVNKIVRPGICLPEPQRGVYPDTIAISGYNIPTVAPQESVWYFSKLVGTSTFEVWQSGTSFTDKVPENRRGKAGIRVYNGAFYSNQVAFMASPGQVGDPCGYDSSSCNQDLNTCEPGLACGQDCTCQVEEQEICTADEDCEIGGCPGTRQCVNGVLKPCADLADACVPFLGGRSFNALFSWAFSAQKKPAPGMSCSSDLWSDGTCDLNGCLDSKLACDVVGADEEWVEIYNPTAAPVALDKYRLFFKDPLTKEIKFKADSIPAYGHLLITTSTVESVVCGHEQCLQTFNDCSVTCGSKSACQVDCLKTYSTCPQSCGDFKLSAVGELSLRLINDINNIDTIDQLVYGGNSSITPAFSPASLGRKIDGWDTDSADNWSYFADATPGLTNNSKEATTTSNHLVINELSLAHDPCTCVPSSQLCQTGTIDREFCEPVGQCAQVRVCGDDRHYGSCTQLDPGCVPYTTIPQATVAVYAWNFNTSFPPGNGPKVVSDCSRTATCDTEEDLPSPTPWNSRWNAENYSNLAITNERACLNAIISARFTRIMDGRTLNKNNIKVYSLTNDAWTDQTDSLIESVETFVSVGESANPDSFTLKLKNNLTADTKYLVFLSKEIKDEIGLPLEEDDDGVNSSYCEGLLNGVCWQFETRSAEDSDLLCDLGCVNCSPKRYFNRYYGEQKKHVADPIAQDNVCLMLDRSDYGWEWSEREQSGKPKIWTIQSNIGLVYSWVKEANFNTGIFEQIINSISAGFATTTAYRESIWRPYELFSSWFTDEDDDYFAIAGEESESDQVGYCPAHNNFTDPIVIENQYCTNDPDPAKRVLQSPSPWKGQRDACTNAAIMALFSRNMLNSSLISPNSDTPSFGDLANTIEVYKCASEAAATFTGSNYAKDCLKVNIQSAKIFNYSRDSITMQDLVNLPSSATNSAEPEGIAIYPSGNLAGESWYKVVIKGGNAGVRGGVGSTSETPEGILRVPSANARLRLDNEDSYYWYFRTGAGACPVEVVTVLPQQKFMKETGLAQEYSADPIADNCNHLNPFNYVWDWNSLIDPAVSRCQSPATDGGENIAYLCALNSVVCSATAEIAAPFVKAFGKLEGLTNITARANGTQSEGQALSCENDKYGWGKLQIGNLPFIVTKRSNTDCINADISAQFSAEVKGATVNKDNILLYECDDAECSITDKTPKIINKFSSETNSFIASINKSANYLTAGKTYRVVIKGGTNGVVSAQNLALSKLNFWSQGNENNQGSEACDPTVAPWSIAGGTENGLCDATNCLFNSEKNLCGTKSQECNNNGLVAYYDFNNVIFNRVGNSSLVNGGKASSSLRYVGGVAGQALNFSNTSNPKSYLQLEEKVVSPDVGTISVWARVLTDPNTEQHILYFSNDAGGDGFGNEPEFSISVTKKPYKFQVFYSGKGDTLATAAVTANTELKLGQWYHLTTTYVKNSSNLLDLKFYVNGVKVGESLNRDFEDSQLTGITKLYLGRANTEGSRVFGGDIDEVAIYDRVLTDREVSSLYNSKFPTDAVYGCNNLCHKLGNDFSVNAPGPYSNLPICGNDKIEISEQCDDGNKVSGDGCSDKCLLEGSTATSADPAGTCGNNRLDNGQPDSYSWTFKLSNDAAVCRDVSINLNPCPNGIWQVKAGKGVTNLKLNIYLGSNYDQGCIKDSDFRNLGFWHSLILKIAKAVQRFFGWQLVSAANYWCPLSGEEYSLSDLQQMAKGNFVRKMSGVPMESVGYTDESDNYLLNIILKNTGYLWGKSKEYAVTAVVTKGGGLSSTSTEYVTTLDNDCQISKVSFDVWPRGANKTSDAFFCASDPSSGKPDECGRYTPNLYDDDMSAPWTSGYPGNGYNLKADGTTGSSGSYKGGNQHLYRVWALSEENYPLVANFEKRLDNISTKTLISEENDLQTSSNFDFWVTSGFNPGRSFLTVTAKDSSNFSASGHLPIFTYFCNNPWPDAGNFPFVDSKYNCTDDSAPCINTNFGTYYCRDAGIAKTCVYGLPAKLNQICETNSDCWGGSTSSASYEQSCQIYQSDDLPAIGQASPTTYAAPFGTGVIPNSGSSKKLKEFLFADIRPVSSGGVLIKGNEVKSQGIKGNEIKSQGVSSGLAFIISTDDQSVASNWDTESNNPFYYEFNINKEGKYYFTLETSNRGNSTTILPVGFNDDYGTCEQGTDLRGRDVIHQVKLEVVPLGSASPVTSTIDTVYAIASSPENRQITRTYEAYGLLPGRYRLIVGWQNNCDCIICDGTNDSYCQGDCNHGTLDSNFKLYSIRINSAEELGSGDAIGIRIYDNDQHYSPSLWYQKQFKPYVQGSLSELIVDGNQAVSEGRTVYVNAPDLGDITGSNSNEKQNIYTNIFLMSYNEKASAVTQNIYSQLINNWFFNAGANADGGLETLDDLGYCSIGGEVETNRCWTDVDCLKRNAGYCRSNKAALTRDTIRLADVQEIFVALNNYYNKSRCSNDLARGCLTKADCYGIGTCGNFYPNLRSGTYITGKTFSAWPSWQENLGKELGVTLPVDPINRFFASGVIFDSGAFSVGQPVACSDTYNPITCWDERNKRLFGQEAGDDLHADTSVYEYVSSADGRGANVYIKGEYSDVGKAIEDFQPTDWSSLGYNPFADYNPNLFHNAIIATCGNGKRDPGENCGNCLLDASCPSGKYCVSNSGSYSCKEKLCGDGIKDPGEQCDITPPNTIGCSSNCQCLPGFNCSGSLPEPICGDGYMISVVEECDFDGSGNPIGCLGANCCIRDGRGKCTIVSNSSVVTTGSGSSGSDGSTNPPASNLEPEISNDEKLFSISSSAKQAVAKRLINEEDYYIIPIFLKTGKPLVVGGMDIAISYSPNDTLEFSDFEVNFEEGITGLCNPDNLECVMLFDEDMVVNGEKKILDLKFKFTDAPQKVVFDVSNIKIYDNSSPLPLPYQRMTSNFENGKIVITIPTPAGCGEDCINSCDRDGCSTVAIPEQSNNNDKYILTIDKISDPAENAVITIPVSLTSAEPIVAGINGIISYNNQELKLEEAPSDQCYFNSNVPGRVNFICLFDDELNQNSYKMFDLKFTITDRKTSAINFDQSKTTISDEFGNTIPESRIIHKDGGILIGTVAKLIDSFFSSIQKIRRLVFSSN